MSTNYNSKDPTTTGQHLQLFRLTAKKYMKDGITLTTERMLLNLHLIATDSTGLLKVLAELLNLDY